MTVNGEGRSRRKFIARAMASPVIGWIAVALSIYSIVAPQVTNHREQVSPPPRSAKSLFLMDDRGEMRHSACAYRDQMSWVYITSDRDRLLRATLRDDQTDGIVLALTVLGKDYYSHVHVGLPALMEALSKASGAKYERAGSAHGGEQ